MENRGKDGYGKSVGYNPLKGWISQNLPVFLEFAGQMENRGNYNNLNKPRISIFSVNLTKNGVKSDDSSSKWNRSQVAISNLQPDFPFFFNEF